MLTSLTGTFSLPFQADDPHWSFEDTQGWNSLALAKMYFHNSETQRQWAWELLGKYRFNGDERILDFGCGDGKVTSELSRLVSEGSVVGVDISSDMLHIAKMRFPPFAYSNLSFSQTVPKSIFDVITSFSVFQFIADPVDNLKTLKTSLIPNGKLLLSIPTNFSDPTLFQAGNETFAKWGLESPWSKKESPPVYSTRTLEGCNQILTEAGYRILTLEMLKTENCFYDTQELLMWLSGTGTANWNVPFSKSIPFFTDFIKSLFRLKPSIVDPEGRILLSLPRIHIIAEAI